MPAAIFDMDGVLVISNPAHFEAWKAFGKRCGIEIDEPTYYKHVNGRRNDEFLEELYPGRWTQEERLRIAAEKEAYYREHFAPKVPRVPGVVELIQALAQRDVPLAVATSGPRENAELITQLLGVRSLFRVMVAGLDVTVAKPDPAIFLEAARRPSASSSKTALPASRRPSGPGRTAWAWPPASRRRSCGPRGPMRRWKTSPVSMWTACWPGCPAAREAARCPAIQALSRRPARHHCKEAAS